MENLATAALYNQLFREFCRIKRPVLATRKAFMERTEILTFKQKDVISALDPQFKKSSYFIISGLVMSYRKFKGRFYVDWIKGDYGYMFSIGMSAASWPEETIVALEDLIVVRILDVDLKWLEFNHSGFGMITSAYHILHRKVPGAREANEVMRYCPEDKYENMQRVHKFSFDRVPDVYLAAYLNVTLKELEEVRGNIQK